MTDAGGEPPKRLGSYSIERLLGRGGMGEVFHARDERLHRWVAIKRIRHDAPPGAEAQERLRREARALASLNHPAIVQVYDIILEEGGYDWIVLEDVPGDSLADLVAAGGLAVARVLDLARQVAEGLAHAHDRGIIHRDLKTENVRLTLEGQAKILDLGLAKLFDKRAAEEGEDDGSLTHQGAIMGTPRVMAPEQAAGGPVDSRADLFSFGVLLYELLAGYSPFLAPSRAETLRKVLSERPAPLSDLRPELPEELSELVAELLARKPEDRPSGAAEVARRLAELATRPEIATLGPPSSQGLSQLDTGSFSPHPLPPTPKPPRPRLRIGVITAALGIATVVLVLWSQRVPSPVLVAVLEPTVTWSGDGGGQAGAIGVAIRASLLETLASLRGLFALDPSEVKEARQEPADVARATGADEVLRSEVICDVSECEVVLRRLEADTSRVLGTRGPFPVSAQAEGRRTLADAVGVQLRRLYRAHQLRKGWPDLDVRDEDYIVYMELRRRYAGGEVPTSADLELLSGVLETSPRFLAGKLLAAQVARTLGRLDEAEGFALAAEGLAPDDPRAVAERFDIAMARGQHGEAGKLLGELKRGAPGDPRTEQARIRLLLDRGQFGEAVSAADALVKRRPSWRNLWYLADAQMRANERKSARRTLDKLLRISPGNRPGLEKRAELELFCDRLETAAETYRELLTVAKHPSYQRALAWTEYLLGHYDEAVSANRRALELDPGHQRARFNLALASEARGEVESAAVLYRQLVAETEAATDATSRLLRAQSQVRLGMPREAVRTVNEVFPGIKPDSQVLYMAAQVFSLAGEQLSALVAAEGALEAGIGIRWFAIPAFEPLAEDREFRALLDGHRGRCD